MFGIVVATVTVGSSLTLILTKLFEQILTSYYNYYFDKGTEIIIFTKYYTLITLLLV